MIPTPEVILKLLGVDYSLKSGRLAFCCPIHDDRDPSAAFYLDTGLAHCFSCGYTVDTVQFYAKVTDKTRAQAIRDLERTLSATIETVQREVDPILLDRSRRWGERCLQEIRHVPRQTHAQLGETLDRILLAYERGQLEKSKLDNLLRIWYNRGEEYRNAIHNGRAPEARPTDGIQEGLRPLPRPGVQGLGSAVDDEQLEDAPDLA